MSTVHYEHSLSPHSYRADLIKFTSIPRWDQPHHQSYPLISPPMKTVAEFRPQEELHSNSLAGAGAFELYLREIGPVALLSQEEEATLAERIGRGDKEAREKMIKANLRLVVKIAREY